MRLTTLTAASLALALAVSGAAQGQQNQSEQPPGSAMEPPQPKGQPEQKRGRQVNTQSLESIPADADKIVGRSVLGQDGEQVGKVSDVLVDKDGKVAGLILTRGGALGVVSKKVVVPWTEASLHGDQLMIKMTEQQVSELPSIE